MAKNVFAEARKLIKPEDGTIAYVVTIDGVTKLHNWEGPALINKEKKIKEYYLHGILHTIDEWKEIRKERAGLPWYKNPSLRGTARL
jgi:hypothetical protein